MVWGWLMVGLEICLGLVLIALAVVAVLYLWTVYNDLVMLRNDVEKAWANIDVLLKQRSDLVPSLVDTVKGYMEHEKETLTRVTRLRAAQMSYTRPAKKAAPSEALSSTLRSIFAVVEKYPKLQANQNFLKLQKQLSAIENQIAVRRESYNDAVKHYNTRIQVLPDSIVAAMLRYKKKDYFRTKEERKG